MTPFTYNTCMLAGVTLIGSGIAMVSVPAALVAVGALVISLTLFAAYLIRKA